MNIDLNKAREIFIEAIGKVPAERWEIFLSARCGVETDLRRHVEHLLKAHAEAGSFLDKPALEAGCTGAYQSGDDQAAACQDKTRVCEGPGMVIGPYKVLQQIGEGGMGTVFLAEQTEPVQRKVALKIIKPGMDSRHVIARFEAERQALALMDHPNIARVLDAGTTDNSRPYFVMELVKGVPITRYCDEHRLTPRQRLELFVPVCQAVQHAHHKGIIHRDLKPSNVLLARYDSQPVPKVIDFGIAKATGPKLTERTLCTEFGQVVGTLEYMSPEQAELNQLDIDTRSDIYSLGVLLYELLTGSTPLERKRLKETPLLEVLRVIREEEPARPSTRLSMTAELPSIAANRGLEPKKLSGVVRGELDWIVMKCLEKDRNRRYETANGLARDIERYLHDEPVQACPPSAAYRFRKFARRNKRTLVTAGLLAVMLLVAVGGVAGSLGWAARDQSARRAEAAQQAQESLTRARAWLGEDNLALARQELAEAKGRIGNDRAALQDLAEEIDALDTELARIQRFFNLSEQAREAEISMQLEPAPSGEMDRELKSSPAAASVIFRDPAKAVPFLLQALSCYQVLERDDWLAALERGLGQAGQVQLVRLSLYVELLRLAEDVLDRGQDHRSGGKLPHAEAARQGLVYMGKAEEARRPTWVFYRLRARCRNALGEKEAASADEALARTTPPAIAEDHFLLGLTALAARDKAEAVKQFEAALRLEPTHYWSLMDLGICLCDLGEQERDLAAAAAAFTGCILKRPQYPVAWNNRGIAYSKLRQYDKAIADHSKAIELKADYTDTWCNRGSAYRESRQYDKAIADFCRAIELKPDFAAGWFGRGAVHADMGQRDKAIADYSRAIELKPDYAPGWYMRGSVHADMGQYDKALGDFSKAIELEPDEAKAWYNRGRFYANLDQFDKAVADYTKAIELKPDYAWAWNNRANAYAKLRQEDKALADYTRAIELRSDHFHAWFNRGRSYDSLGQPEKAIADYTKAIELKLDFSEALFRRGMAYAKLHQDDKAIADYTRVIGLKPDEVEALVNRGAAYADLRQYDKAVADYSRAIELKPDLAVAWCNRGNANSNLRKHDQAMSDYSRAIELKPEYVEAWYNRGRARSALRHYDEAVADYSRAIELRADFAEAWCNRGNAYVNLRQYDQAVAEYSRAIELKGDLLLAWYNRGDVYVRLRRWDKAIADFAKAGELNPARPAALNRRAWLLANCPESRLRDPRHAVELARKAVQLGPKIGSYWKTLGVAHYRAGDQKEAIAALEKSMALGKGGDGLDWFFLAMAQWQLGHKDEARTWYDKAVAWMDMNQADNEDLRGCRAEAEEVLRLEKK
jgi:tetratricopeptide (TPR) repeat protein/serine/threonine protein kinase